MSRFFVLLALLLLTALTQVANSATVLVLQPFESTYELIGRGLLKAKHTVSLSRNNNHYVLTSTIDAKGLASLAGYGPVVETSKFKIAFGRIQPLSYRKFDRSGMLDLNQSIVFDWNNKIVRSKKKEKIFELPLKGAVLDPLTVMLSARLDLVSGALEPTYLVHEGDQIRTYHISHLPVQTIQIADRQFVCIHLVVDTERPKRKVHYWMVPELAYLPIQSKQFHDDNLEFSAILITSTLLP